MPEPVADGNPSPAPTEPEPVEPPSTTFKVLPMAVPMHLPIHSAEYAQTRRWNGGWVFNPGASKGIKVVMPGRYNGRLCAVYAWDATGWSVSLPLWKDPEEGDRLRCYSPRVPWPATVMVRVDTLDGDLVLTVPDTTMKMR